MQRLDDDIDVVVYYADPANPDVTAPLVGAVSANIAGGSLTVSLTAGVEPGDGVDRVYLLVAENPTVSASVVDWKGLDLTRTPGTNRWTGSLLLTPGTNDVEFIVQAKDPAGNVGFATNKARNFGEVASAPVPPPPPPPPADQLSVTVPTPPESGWFDGSVEIVIAAAATPASVFVNGVQRPGTLEAGQTFTIDADGVQNWTVVTEAGRTTSGTVRVDADGDPRVVLGVPSERDPVYPTGTRRVDVICRDTSLVSCALTIDGQTVANGDPLPTALGEYTLGYTAIDQIGRETTGTAPFRIAAVVAPPVITSPGIPTVPADRGWRYDRRTLHRCVGSIRHVLRHGRLGRRTGATAGDGHAAHWYDARHHRRQSALHRDGSVHRHTDGHRRNRYLRHEHIDRRGLRPGSSARHRLGRRSDRRSADRVAGRGVGVVQRPVHPGRQLHGDDRLGRWDCR